MLIAEQAGIRAIMAHPIDQEAARCYTRFGFISSPLREQQLLPLLKDARRWVRRTMPIESRPTFTKPARQRWETIPADIGQRLLSNAWCGQCAECRSDVARVIEGS